MKATGGKLESNVVQFFSESEQDRLKERFQLTDGDVLIMVADVSRELVNKVLSSLRLHMADRLGMIPADSYSPLWVTDFPLFELKAGKLGSQHHPFTMPDRIDVDPTDQEDLINLKSRAYDLVMNGEELGGGSIRIHDMEIQRKIFRALELTDEETEAKFGFFIRALEYGAPPHGGLAFGLDPLPPILTSKHTIRDVIAFPKTQKAYDPMTEAPSRVSPAQLRELSIKLDIVE